MADATGRIMLATGEPPPWYIEQFVVFVCEGEVDFWTVAAWVSDTDETPPAVLGVTSSSWCAEVAARVPEGSLVITLTDDDEAGDRYAGTVRESLRDRAVDVRDRKRRGPRAKARS
jgi:5S rRNA maturation endonuclease (ribonuclease M5)